MCFGHRVCEWAGAYTQALMGRITSKFMNSFWSNMNSFGKHFKCPVFLLERVLCFSPRGYCEQHFSLCPRLGSLLTLAHEPTNKRQIGLFVVLKQRRCTFPSDHGCSVSWNFLVLAPEVTFQQFHAFGLSINGSGAAWAPLPGKQVTLPE